MELVFLVRLKDVLVKNRGGLSSVQDYNTELMKAMQWLNTKVWTSQERTRERHRHPCVQYRMRENSVLISYVVLLYPSNTFEQDCITNVHLSITIIVCITHQDRSLECYEILNSRSALEHRYSWSKGDDHISKSNLETKHRQGLESALLLQS